MARIRGEDIDLLNREVSVQRLVEAQGIELKRHGADPGPVPLPRRPRAVTRGQPKKLVAILRVLHWLAVTFGTIDS